MNNLVTVLEKLGEKIKTFDTSATVVYDILGNYNGLTPFPLYEIEIKSLTEDPQDLFKFATIQLNLHSSATNLKTGISGLNERYDKKTEMIELVRDWSYEMSQLNYSFGGVQRYSATIHSLDRDEIGNGNKGFRIFLEFDITYRDN